MEPTWFLSVLSFYAALLLVRRSLALTPLIHRKRSPFPPGGEGLVECATSGVVRIGCLHPCGGRWVFRVLFAKNSDEGVFLRFLLLMEPTRFFSVLSFYAVLLLVRRSLALTPLIHRKRSPFPPGGEGLGGGANLYTPFRPSLVGLCRWSSFGWLGWLGLFGLGGCRGGGGRGCRRWFRLGSSWFCRARR